MITLNAEIKGAFADDFSGSAVVASVYSKAVNILLSNSLLLSIVRSEDELSALSILVPELFSEGIEISHLFKSGAEVSITGERVRAENVEIDLRNADLWDCSLIYERSRINWETIALLEKALMKYGKKGGLLGIIDKSCEPDIFTRKALEVLEGPAETPGIEQPETPVVLQGLSGLVGLGIGFTPSGDDFIASVIMGERIAKAAGKPYPVIDRRDIENALYKTSYGGRTLLWQVLRNQFPFYMVKFIKSLLRGEPSEIAASVSKTVLHGETSGTDFLTGLLWFLKK